MDSASHSISGGLIFALPAAILGAPPFLTGTLFGIGIVVGGLPDTAGELEVEPYDSPKLWNWYVEAHHGAINTWMFKHFWMGFPLPWILHTYLDTFTHGEGKRWWHPKERLWAEVLYAGLNIVGVWWLISILSGL